jgi:adenylate cyclase
MIGRADLWKLFRQRLGFSIPGLLVLLIIVILQLSTNIDRTSQVGSLIFDQYQRWKPRAYNPDGPARIVDVDDDTIAKLGQWPWPRSDVADLTARLTNAGATVVAFDISFSEPDRTAPSRLAERAQRDGATPEAVSVLKTMADPDAQFAATIQQSQVVLGIFLGHDAKTPPVEPKAGFASTGSMPIGAVESYTSAIQPLPNLRAAALGLGFMSLPPDSDGIIRRAPLLAAQGDQFLPSLSIETLRVAQGAGAITVKAGDAQGEMQTADDLGNFAATSTADVAKVKVGEFEVPTTPKGELWMYYTAQHPERVTPAWQILTGKLSQAEMEKRFGGKIVFVGASAQGLYDLKSTPIVGREMGVAVHAQAVEQMYYQQFLSRPYWALVLERTTLLAAGILMALLLPWMGAARGALLGVLMIGGMVLSSWLAFSQHQILLDPTFPVLSLALLWVIGTVYTYYREERQRAYIHQAFDRYLSPEMVKRIVEDPGKLELGGEEREMTVLFCDIRQFSRISEKLGPQEIIRFLIGFLTPMCDILLARKATIDKFIGDAILAFWNAPLDDPDQYGNAARGALDMQARLQKLNTEMAKQSVVPWPGDVQIGIGMNSGPCCVGNMGSAQRLSYSLIGDTVNVASRIEGLTKYYGVGIALGDSLYEHLREFACVALDHVRVVGRDTPETVYALLGDEAMAVRPDFIAFAFGHDAMIRAYRTQAWDEAEGLLGQWQAAAEGYGLTRLYALMRERIVAYRISPPGADWDGVYGATEK